MDIPDKTKKKILDKIKRLKNKKYNEVFIEGNFHNNKFRLLLLTYDSVLNIPIIRLLSKWRKKNEFWFLAIFKITTNGTQIWLKERVMDVPDRLLFMIKVKNQYIGHVGLYRFNFNKNFCEIDNIMRGKPLYPGIMKEAIKKMMEWGKKNLNLKSYELETFLDNERALRLYQKLGFRENKRIPLIQREKGDRKEWVPSSKDYQGKIIRYNVIMKLYE